MQFEYDPERLIEEVRKRPGIWNFDDVSYRSKEARHKLWTQVVEELLGTVKVSKGEMRELEVQLQKKWKSIRDCFHKFTQNPNRTKRPYVYSKQLQFLLAKNESANDAAASSGSEDGKRPVSWSNKRKRLLTKAEPASSDDDDAQHDDAIEDSGLNEIEISIPSKPAKVSRQYDEFAFANVDQKPEGEDCDKMFLLSLLPHLKAIPEEARLGVKMDLMQVLREANYGGSTMKLL